MLTLSDADRKERILITEVDLEEKAVRNLFKKNGFEIAFPEEKKTGQSGDGMLKSIDNDWDMHVRFFHFHNGMTAIDAEVETSRKYIEHLTKPENWISVLREVWDILKQITDKI